MTDAGSKSASEDAWSHHPKTSYHSAGRGIWSPETIAEAFRSWADETGTAPTTLEWNSTIAERRETAGGRKFADERDRWPQAGTVYEYYENWAAACTAAGIAPPRRPGPPAKAVAARVEHARWLSAEGLTQKEIAEEIGVSTQAVWRYLRATDCVGCGTPVASLKSERCQQCAAIFRAAPRWTAEEILAAAKAWRRETGRCPHAPDWMRGSAKWEREGDRWPTAEAVRGQLGGFQELRLALGVAPYAPMWTEEAQLDAIRQFAAEHGRPPRAVDLNRTNGKYPTVPTLKNTFGSFSAAIRAAGFTPGRTYGRRGT